MATTPVPILTGYVLGKLSFEPKLYEPRGLGVTFRGHSDETSKGSK